MERALRLKRAVQLLRLAQRWPLVLALMVRRLLQTAIAVGQQPPVQVQLQLMVLAQMQLQLLQLQMRLWW